MFKTALVIGKYVKTIYSLNKMATIERLSLKHDGNWKITFHNSFSWGNCFVHHHWQWHWNWHATQIQCDKPLQKEMHDRNTKLIKGEMFDRFFSKKKIANLIKFQNIWNYCYCPVFFLDTEFLCYKLLRGGNEKEVKKPSINNS